MEFPITHLLFLIAYSSNLLRPFHARWHIRQPHSLSTQSDSLLLPPLFFSLLSFVLRHVVFYLARCPFTIGSPGDAFSSNAMLVFSKHMTNPSSLPYSNFHTFVFLSCHFTAFVVRYYFRSSDLDYGP